MKRMFFVGPHGSGKTTLVRKLNEKYGCEFPLVRFGDFFSKPDYFCKKYFKKGPRHLDASERQIFQQLLFAEMVKYESVPVNAVDDRCLIDVAAYTTDVNLKKSICEYVRLNYNNQNDKIILLTPLSNTPEDNGIRFVTDVEQSLEDYKKALSMCGVRYYTFTNNLDYEARENFAESLFEGHFK